MCKIFGEKTVIESFGIPQKLYGDFSVFGVDSHCKAAVEFVQKSLQSNKRVEILVLLYSADIIQKACLQDLENIQNFGSRIYCFLKIQDVIPNLEVYRELAKRATVFLYKA